jgi:heterodisulfide reductase subunit A2
MSARIGVYICHCGSNIAGKVDVPTVTRFAGGLPDVVVARDYVFMCSEPGQEQIRRDISQHQLDRVVVASCSPLMHEPTFRRACAKAGLNPYMCQIANIREQCSWSTEDAAAATEKALALVSGAVGKARALRPLGVREVPVTQAVLIVGGGIAGIQAALACAEAGKKVYPVERQQSIGGHMAMLDKTFPTLDCSACILTPKMVSAGQHPNITLMNYSEVEEVSGSTGNMKIKIRRKATYVDAAKCNGCGLCQEKCPYKATNAFEQGKTQRRAIYTLFPQAVPNKPVIDRDACKWFAADGGNGDGKKKTRCGACAKLCPTKAIDFEQQDRLEEIEVGAVILTTGHQMFDAATMTQYGYGTLPDVYTGLEFERMVNSGGYTKGEIQTSDGRHPKSVGIVHCVGSRDQRFQPYCSSICCMYSLKFAHLVHEHSAATIYNFYIDMRCVGKGYEEFYDRLLGEGVRFVRGKVASVVKGEGAGEEKQLVATVEDTLAGVVRRIPLDMVILANGLKAQADADAVGRQFGVSRNKDGFFIEQHPKLNPVGTPNECIFIAGTCAGPKDIPHSVAQASAAAAGALTLLDRGKLTLEPIAAHVQEELCSGCRTCLELCPYSAVGFDEATHRAEVDDTSCHGCGTCVAACPSGAMAQDHFRDEQIFAEIEGLLGWEALRDRPAAPTAAPPA